MLLTTLWLWRIQQYWLCPTDLTKPMDKNKNTYELVITDCKFVWLLAARRCFAYAMLEQLNCGSPCGDLQSNSKFESSQCDWFVGCSTNKTLESATSITNERDTLTALDRCSVTYHNSNSAWTPLTTHKYSVVNGYDVSGEQVVVSNDTAMACQSWWTKQMLLNSSQVRDVYAQNLIETK
jgi:hypothetical protein